MLTDLGLTQDKHAEKKCVVLISEGGLQNCRKFMFGEERYEVIMERVF